MMPQTDTPLTRPPIERFQELAEKATKGPYTVRVTEKESYWRRFAVISPDGIVCNVDEGKVADMEANANLIEVALNAIPELCKYVLALEREKDEACHRLSVQLGARAEEVAALESRVRERETKP